MDSEADNKVPEVEVENGLQLIGSREGWQGQNLESFQARLEAHWCVLVASVGPYAIYCVS